MTAITTAEYVAFYRALETLERRREPLVRDPFAAAFLRRRLALAIRAAHTGVGHRVVSQYVDARAPGIRLSAAARTRFIDDLAVRCAAEGVTDLVVLGAGFDCRAHRLTELRGLRVFEVDRPEMQSAKRAGLLASRSPARHDVRYAPVDLLVGDAGERLAAAGWDRQRPTMFIWEGVTNYLPEHAVLRALAWIGRASAGSSLVFSYVHAGFLDGSTHFQGADSTLRKVRRSSEPWISGFDPSRLAQALSRCGLTLREDLGADEYRRRYLGASPGAARTSYQRLAVATVQSPS